VPAVFFLSDYGTADEFVGVVHAVLHRQAPGVPVIDLSHQIPPFAVDAGAALLVRCLPHLGPGVVLAVVDPGVGTARRAVAVGVPGRMAGDPTPPTGPTWLVGPDNGLLAPAVAALGGAARVVVLTRDEDGNRSARGGPEGPPRFGRTFDGRDVFAPAAAHLAAGDDPGALGPDADPASLVHLPADVIPARASPGSEIVTTVTWVDRFGNVQLGLDPGAVEGLGVTLGGTAWIEVEDRPVDGGGTGTGPGRPVPARWVTGFGQLGPDELGLVVDSAGRMALVLDRAPAAILLGATPPGRAVRITGPSGGGPDPR
jgi:S-adenosyl-L-methionine hydrolase (adenosine-forming)